MKKIDKNKMEPEKLNKQFQGVDKDPREEKAKGEKVTKDDLKGKKVDRVIVDKSKS